MIFAPLLLEALLIPIVSVIVFYMVVLQYRLPFSQVALTLVVIALLTAIITRLVTPNPHKPVSRQDVVQTLPSLLGLGLLDIVFGLGATILKIIIASYRFNAIEIASLIGISWVSGTVGNMLMKAL
jgi:hypothetical protein